MIHFSAGRSLPYFGSHFLFFLHYFMKARDCGPGIHCDACIFPKHSRTCMLIIFISGRREETANNKRVSPDSEALEQKKSPVREASSDFFSLSQSMEIVTAIIIITYKMFLGKNLSSFFYNIVFYSRSSQVGNGLKFDVRNILFPLPPEMEAQHRW